MNYTIEVLFETLFNINIVKNEIKARYSRLSYFVHLYILASEIFIYLYDTYMGWI